MVRRATDKDERAVARIMRGNVSPIWTDEQIRAAFSSESTDIYVYDDGEVRGYIIAENVLDECCIASVAVEADSRRKGAGRALMAAALSGNAVSTYLEVNEHNGPAIALYKSCGFEVAGVRKGYYGDASAYVMIRRSVSKNI